MAKKKKKKNAYEQSKSLIYNSNFMRIKKQEGEEVWGGEEGGALITLFLIINADGIIPLIILYSPVDRHSNLIAGQKITIWYNFVSVSI